MIKLLGYRGGWVDRTKHYDILEDGATTGDELKLTLKMNNHPKGEDLKSKVTSVQQQPPLPPHTCRQLAMRGHNSTVI